MGLRTCQLVRLCSHDEIVFVQAADLMAPPLQIRVARNHKNLVHRRSVNNDLDPFIREQELMRELISKSMLPSLTLDISDNNINAAVERVADWMEQSGGLYMPD